MLYGNESISHYTFGNIIIWMSMAFQAGLLNIGGFMACHRFVSHITGFATFFGYEINQIDNRNAFGMLVVPLFFILGVMLSGQLVDIRLKLHKRPKYYLTFGLIFILNCLVLVAGFSGYFGVFGEPLELFRDYALLILLCLICGIQNGTVATVSRSVIRTTHLTGISTDLGLGIVRFLNRKKLKGDIENENHANLMRTGLILSFCVGSVCGGYVFTKLGYLGFSVPSLTSGILFGAMLFFQVFRNSPLQMRSTLKNRVQL